MCVCVRAQSIINNDNVIPFSVKGFPTMQKSVMSDFLTFVNANSQPNSRREGSYSAQFFFHLKFSRIAPPRQGEKNFDDKAHTSLVAEFNWVQRELGKGTCGPTAASEWLKKHRPKVTLHPSMTDYCDTCKNLKEELCRTQAISNRLHQSGSAAEADLRAHRDHKVKLEEEMRQHKEDATKAREYYRECVDKCKKNWSDIMRLTSRRPLTPAERGELETLQHCFTPTISADYQQSKLILSWGKTEQPRSTYYLQKVSHDIFGIVDHRDDEGTLYLFDERIGPKNTDHTISFLLTYWQRVSQQHPWIQRLAIFLDNATSTNKNRFLFAWTMEMVSQGQVSHIHISFMLAGHTKFAPDRLFAKTGSAYKTADIFTIHELQRLCTPSASTVVEDGDNVLTWRDTLGAKYSDLPGVRKLHDFLTVKGYNGHVVMKVREKCFTGEWRQSPLRLLDATTPGIPTTTYKDAHSHNIKLANMVTMYNRFISPDRRPEYLPPLQPALTLQHQPSSSSTIQHQPTSTSGRQEPPRRRKQRQMHC